MSAAMHNRLDSMVDVTQLVTEEFAEQENPEYGYMDGFKHGLITALCIKHGWTQLPPDEQHASRALQQWLIVACKH